MTFFQLIYKDTFIYISNTYYAYITNLLNYDEPIF